MQVFRPENKKYIEAFFNRTTIQEFLEFCES